MDLLVSQMIKPVETVEIFFLEVGKIAKAIRNIGKLARQFLDMKQDDP